MLVLGIDPGLAITGYGLIRETAQQDLQAISYGVIQTSPGMVLQNRLLNLYNEVKQLILLHRPSSAAVEKLFFQKNMTTALSVGQARGVILLALAEQDVPVAEYSPKEIKQAATGFGGATKQQIQEMVRTLLSLPQAPQPDDAADALAVAICHIHTDRLRELIDQEKLA